MPLSSEEPGTSRDPGAWSWEPIPEGIVEVRVALRSTWGHGRSEAIGLMAADFLLPAAKTKLELTGLRTGLDLSGQKSHLHCRRLGLYP